MLNNFLAASALIIFICSSARSDSWVEKPDIDFYAHPFVENMNDGTLYRSGTVAEVSETMKVKSAGKIYNAENFTGASVMKKGQRVLCAFDGESAMIIDYNRIPVMLILAAVFIAGVIMLNFKTGLRAVLALILSLTAVYFLFISAVLKGINPVVSGFLVCAVVSLITLFLVGAKKEKTVPAFLGTLGGILTVFISAKIFLMAVKTDGFSDEQIQLLNYLGRNYKTAVKDISGVFLAGILVAATGVIMDVAISISSSLKTIMDENPGIGKTALFSRGMNIGRDIIASMANSLLFAYAGSALFLIISKSYFTYSFTQLFNSDWFAVIIVEIFSGTLGLIMAVPLTSLISALMLLHRNRSS